ncbi:MFS transporter [Gordonia sp. ABSL49_1]|uniref:MFS transporter n=1 Tax=unclassified Gordonia (in: high G+C Gram-positive bacteria) TaxID=2657482 RepID=UPI001F0D7B8D|nr:MFS transporter [Gordonia sp. ABSL49_1]MCH5645454.1 MFS transporter [Gordonia sp. ABSL49_1]
MWVAHIPVISAQTGVGHDQLGGLLLLLGASAFVGMQVCGPLIDRFGSKPLTIAAALLLSAVIVAPVLSHSAAQLAAALVAFGFANGSLDVSMNAQAVAVERAYRRPIMSAFHGFFSIGGLVGSGLVAATLWADVGPVKTVAVAAAAGAVLALIVSRALAGPNVGAEAATATDDVAERETGRTPRWWDGVDLRRLALLAAVAFALMLAEGTAYDWSALHIVETFGTSEAVGAVAFGAFSAAMTVARFVVDGVVERVGAVAVVRYGSLIGLVGMVTAISAPTPAVAITGWIVFGIGLAGLIPQIFTAAGNLTAGTGGRTISMVVGCGYLGMLAGPAVVGFISSTTTLGTGLIAAVAALVFAGAAAGVVRPRSARRATLEG